MKNISSDFPLNYTLLKNLKKILRQNQWINTLFSLVTVNFIIAGLSFVTTLLIANSLGKEHFGDFSYAAAIGGYYLTFVSCGLERTLIRDFIHHPELINKYTSASIVLRVVMLLIFFSLITIVNALLAEDKQVELSGFIIIIAQGITALYLAPNYDVSNQMKRHAVYAMLERLFYVVCVWGLIFFLRNHVSILSISIVMLSSVFLGLFLQYRWIMLRLNIQITYDIFQLAWQLFKKNISIWIALLATLSFGTLSKIVLKNFSGSSELGGYAVAWQIVPLGLIMITQIGRVGNPKMARIVQSDVLQERRISFLLKYIILSASAGLCIALPAILCPEAILRIFRPEYAGAALILRIFGGYVIILAFGQVAMQYLVATHRETLYSLIVILTGGISIVLYFVFVPLWAAPGAAWAVLVSHGIAILSFLCIMVYNVLKYPNDKAMIAKS